MNFDHIVHALEARRCGSSWMARCPAHHDRTPSLAIREVDGKVLVRCHAGCQQRDVIEALRARGLWQFEHPESPRIVATYDYTDEHGELLYQIVRFEPKTFRHRRPDGCGEWTWKKSNHQVLYHLPEVLEAPIVFVVEGEKDVETLRAHGFVATTNAGGANAPWLPEFTQALAGREVILIPDQDAPGKERVINIMRALRPYAGKLTVLELEGAKDVTEWFDQGHSELELIFLLEAQKVTR